MENFFTRDTDSSAFFPSFPIIQHNCLGVVMFFFHFSTALPCCLTLLCLLLFKTRTPDVRFCRHSRDLCPSPPPSWPPTGSHSCFSYLEPALALLNSFS